MRTIIDSRDIDFSSLSKLNNQGTKSTIFTSGDTCIKVLDKLYPFEKEELHHKLDLLDGVEIDGVIMPQDLIMKDGKLFGYTMDYFKDSVDLNTRFLTLRFVCLKDLLEAVKQASIILKKIHENEIICSDLSFDNILIDKNGKVKYCDIDGCCYRGVTSPFVSNVLASYLNHRDMKFPLISENTDRLSFFLSFYMTLCISELHRRNNKAYRDLLKESATLQNMDSFVQKLRNNNESIPELPYIDDLIDDTDEYIIDRNKQLTLIQKIFHII